jgi:hypothetical protein
MEFSVETITPAIALKMMNETERLGFINRSLRKAKVEQFAHAMVTHQWLVTHQPIAVTDDGAVTDGQHRLAAVILADLDIQMLVMRGADPETFKVVDTGAVRTTGDSLKIAGYTNVNHLAAIVRGYLAYATVMGTNDYFRSTSSRITTADVFSFLEDDRHRSIAEGALLECARTANGLARYGLKTSLAMALMTCRLRTTDLGASTVEEFYARLQDGASLPADSPILALRRWFMHDNGYAKLSGEARRPVATANTIKALNDYALGKPRSLVIFRPNKEPWPAPLPRGSRRKYEKELEDQGR